jgi:DNA replication protein DnaC
MSYTPYPVKDDAIRRGIRRFSTRSILLHTISTRWRGLVLATPLTLAHDSRMRDELQGATVEPTSTTCLICGGSGFKIVEGEDSKGRKTQRATKCDCQMEQRAGRLMRFAGVPDRYEHCELSNFETDPGGKHSVALSNAKLAAGRFIEEYPVERDGLLLIGPVGVGKTHLAVGIVKELVAQKGTHCLFYDYRELLKQIQNSYNSSVQTTEMEVLRPVFDAEVLVLDELGAVKPTEWVWDTVSHILNTRYNDKRTTIITTNYRDLPPGGSDGEPTRYSAAAKANREETLGDRIGERMRSRLHEMCRVVKLDGDDFRIKYRSASFR